MANARQVRGGLPEYGYRAEGAGLRKGVVLVVGASNIKAKIAAAIGAGKIRGIQIDEGTLPDGVADPNLPDLVTAQKTGIAQALVPAASVAAEGDQAWSDATGKVIKRAPFSFSGLVLGQFDEGFTAGANPEYRGVELFPHYVEVIRAITAASMDTFAAATRYIGAPGVALNAAQIPIYRARFAGEVIRNLAVSLVTAPGGADTVVFTVMKSSDNGATWTDTALTATISGASKVPADPAAVLALSATLAAGDLLAVKAVSSAITAAKPTVTFDVT
jgi:hypothetical protein